MQIVYDVNSLYIINCKSVLTRFYQYNQQLNIHITTIRQYLTYDTQMQLHTLKQQKTVLFYYRVRPLRIT